jgi:hypothetical protein
MKMIFRQSLLAISALSMAVSPAHAATIVTPSIGTPVTATGSFNINAAPTPATARSCTVTMNGVVTAADKIMFTDGTSNCDIPNAAWITYTLEYPITFQVLSPTAVKTNYLSILTFQPCARTNAFFSLGSSTITQATLVVGNCSMTNFTLTISPTVTVIP